MLIGLNRFLKKAEVVAAYDVPPKYTAEVLALADSATLDPGSDDERVLTDTMDRLLNEWAGGLGRDRADGPRPPSIVRVDGVDYDGLAPNRWRLVDCLWGRDSRPIDEVIEAVWGDASAVKDKALASLLKHTRQWFGSVGCPLTVGVRGGHVRMTRKGQSKKNSDSRPGFGGGPAPTSAGR